jgi:hypothetical protein
LPPAPQAPGLGGGGNAGAGTALPVGLGGFSMGRLPGTIPPKPANWDAQKARTQAQRAGGAKSVSDANLFALTPFAPQTLSARGQFAEPHGGLNGVLDCYEYLSSDDPSTPGVLETFDAQHLSGGATELHVWGALTTSNVQDMIYAELGLVTDYTYNFAMDPDQDGNPADLIPPYMFNQNVGLMNAVYLGSPFAAPADYNGIGGLGFARGYAPARGYDFDLRLLPDQSPGGTGGVCWLRVRPRLAPYPPWSAYSGDPLNPLQGYPYGIDNWGWKGPEDFSGALILAQIYSYNATGLAGDITFQYVRATQGPLTLPTVDCRALASARFLVAGPGADGLQGTPDDVALTGWNSTNAMVVVEPVLLLGDKFYVFFDRDPAQVNDIALYPNVPAAGMVQSTTTGLIADPALAAYFDLPDAVPGWPGMVYSAAHPFVLVLRNGAYNRITNDVRSLSWAHYELHTNPGNITFAWQDPVTFAPLDTSRSNLDRVILAQGVQYTPYYYNLAYTQAGSYPPPGGFGAAETIYPNAHTTGWISVGYNALTEGGSVLGAYYDQAGLTNTLQADAYCRFETRTNWGPGPAYGMADFDLLAWITPPLLDPRSRPWNTAVYARGINFFLQTTDASVSPVVNVAPGRLLDAGLGPVAAVNFNTSAAGGGPYNGSFNVLPVRVYDDPAASDPDANVTRIAGAPPQWDVVVNFLLQYGAANYTVELDSDWGAAWNDGPAGRVYQIDGDPATPGMQQFTVSGVTYSRTVRIPNSHPAGGFNFAIRVTDSLGAQYIYVWGNAVWLPGAPQIDARTLASARFTTHRPSGAVLANNLDTDVVYNAFDGLPPGQQINVGDSFYVDFQLDLAASPNDRALYPARPALGVVTYTVNGMAIDPTLTPYFDTTDGGYTLHLRTGAYNRIVNDVRSLSWANYSLIEDGTGTVITAARATNTSNADNVVLRANINYRPRFSNLPYPGTGSSLRAETIYPVEWVTGYISTGFGALGEGGSVLGNYFDQAGLVNTLQADAFCRFESDARPMVPGVLYGFNDVTAGAPIVPVVLDPLARPFDALALARGTVFNARDALANVSANVTVGAGRVLNGATSLNLPLGAGSLNLNVLPVRVFDDPAQSDPDANVTAVAGGWNVVLNFLLQYGAPNYTVELDGDWGAAWNDGTAGRIYAVPGSPFAAAGLKSATVNILSASQPAGNYTFALRVTDGAGAQYVYVWPNQVLLGGWVVSNPNPASAGDSGQYSSLAVVAGFPAIAYYRAAGGNDLMYVRALDANGLAWGAPVTVDAAGNTGQYCSLAVVNGNPAIAYYRPSGTQLRYVRATNATGSAWGAPQVLDSAPGEDSGKFCSLAVIAGKPSVEYSTESAAGNEYRYIRASDANGAAWLAPQGFYGAPVLGGPFSYFSLVDANGHVGLAYYIVDSSTLQYANGYDPDNFDGGNCSLETVDGFTPLDRGQCASARLVAGNPAIAYRCATNTELRYVRATDAFGVPGAWMNLLVVDAATDVGLAVSLATIAGNPAIAYYDEAAGNLDLLYIRATDATGGAWGAVERVDGPGNVGQYCSMAEVNGNAGISYYDATNGDLKFVRRYP